MAVSITGKKYRYFIFSQKQYQERSDAESKLGKRYIPGKVMVHGVYRDFTEISTSPSNSRYADGKLVAEGYLDELKYIMNSSEGRTR